MATVSGIKECDKCGTLMRADESTEAKTTFKGKVNGSHKKDLCEECLEPEIKDIEITPSKSKTAGTEDQQEDNPE